VTVADAAGTPRRPLQRAGAVLLGAGLTGGMTVQLLVALESGVVVALPVGIALAASLVRDARITAGAALELDLVALAAANSLLLATLLAGDVAAVLLAAAVAGIALGFVGARAWAIYLAVLMAVGLSIWGLLFSVAFVPAVIAGVVARPDARP
jgi:hypothetical protein